MPFLSLSISLNLSNLHTGMVQLKGYISVVEPEPEPFLSVSVYLSYFIFLSPSLNLSKLHTGMVQLKGNIYDVELEPEPQISLSISIPLSFSLSIYLSIYLPLSLLISLNCTQGWCNLKVTFMMWSWSRSRNLLYLSQFFSLSIYLSIYLPLSLSLSIYISLDFSKMHTGVVQLKGNISFSISLHRSPLIF